MVLKIYDDFSGTLQSEVVLIGLSRNKQPFKIKSNKLQYL